MHSAHKLCSMREVHGKCPIVVDFIIVQVLLFFLTIRISASEYYNKVKKKSENVSPLGNHSLLELHYISVQSVHNRGA
jgi:hypothetical protein